MEFLETLLAVAAPHRCVGCNSEGQVLCIDCRLQVPSKDPTCYVCNCPSPSGVTCGDCRSQTDLAGVMVATPYEGMIKDLVKALKYQHQVAVAKGLAQLLSPLLSPADYDVVTAVPAAPSRYRHRGYHQAELIAKRVALDLGLPYRCLLGRLETESLVGSSRAERFEMVRDSFFARRSKSIRRQRILVIDDVLTTGATLSEAAKVLTAAGAKTVWGAAVAKH